MNSEKTKEIFIALKHAHKSDLWRVVTITKIIEKNGIQESMLASETVIQGLKPVTIKEIHAELKNKILMLIACSRTNGTYELEEVGRVHEYACYSEDGPDMWCKVYVPAGGYFENSVGNQWEERRRV